VRGIEIPPPEDDFTADPAELFFDLTYVFAFNRLVYLLVHEPDWAGFGEFALLMTMIWVPWTQFTWSANAVAGNTRSVRALFMIATVASVPMAGSVTAALGDDGNGGVIFAVSLSVILGMALATMIFGLDPDSTARHSIVRYSANNWIGMALMITGGFLDRTPRIIVWIAAMVVVVAGTVTAGGQEWIVRPGHFAERHGLIAIVALGELIVAVGIPVVDSFTEAGDLPLSTLAALVAAGAFAGLTWWSLFDRPMHALEHRHEMHDDVVERGRFARDVYTYAFLPVVAGIIISAAGLEEITLHPRDELPEPFRWMYLGGICVTMVGIVLAIWRAFGRLAVERIVAAVLLLGLAAVATSIEGLVLLIVVDVVMAVTLVIEHLRVEWRYRDEKVHTTIPST
jgi:low temperature requirement protein LtrA